MRQLFMLRQNIQWRIGRRSGDKQGRRCTTREIDAGKSLTQRNDLRLLRGIQTEDVFVDEALAGEAICKRQ